MASLAEVQTGKSATSSDAPLTRTDRILGLESIYRVAKQCYAGFERVPDLNWDKAFAEFLPKVEDEQDTLAYYRTLQRFMSLLQDGHCDVYLPQGLQARLGTLPVRLNLIEKQIVVVERRPTADILNDDIPPGTVVEAIEGEPPVEFLKREYGPFLRTSRVEILLDQMSDVPFFAPDSKLHLSLHYPSGEKRIREINPFMGKMPKPWTREMYQKYFQPWHRDMESLHSEFVAPGILYVRYPSCNSACEESFCKLIEVQKDAPLKALIMDLRGNVGGNTPERAMRHLISTPIKYFSCRTRCSIGYSDANVSSPGSEPMKGVLTLSRDGLPALQLSGNWLTISLEFPPDAKHYDGPLYLLTNAETASAAEDMVGPLQSAGRATVIGEATCGSSGQPIMVDLPGGGTFRICTLDLCYPDGRKFVGKGIQPDVPVKRTVKGIAEGQDEVMQAALGYVGHITVPSGNETQLGEGVHRVESAR